MQRSTLAKHVAVECDFTVIPCQYKDVGCSATVKRKDMKAHEEDNKQLHLSMAMKTIATLKQSNEDLKSRYAQLVNKPRFVTAFSIWGYQSKKENDTKYSTQPFYTSESGYSLSIIVYVNGDTYPNTMSVYAKCMHGRYDKDLAWPFVGTVIITLLNQLEDKNHYTKSIAFTTATDFRPGSTRGYPSFISHSALARATGNTRYLKDGILVFNVYVK